MRYLFSLFLSLALLGTSGPVLAQIEQEVSEVTGAKRLVSNNMRNLVTQSYPGHGSFRAEYENPTEKDPIWRLSLFGFAKDTTEMSAASTLRMTVDGETITPTTVESRTRKLKESILEIKDATFTRSAFQKIATGKTVKASIGPFQFGLTRPLRKDLRLILDRVPKGKGPQTASSDDSASSQ
jgi:hypothetical protein